MCPCTTVYVSRAEHTMEVEQDARTACGLVVRGLLYIAYAKSKHVHEIENRRL